MPAGAISGRDKLPAPEPYCGDRLNRDDLFRAYLDFILFNPLSSFFSRHSTLHTPHSAVFPSKFERASQQALCQMGAILKPALRGFQYCSLTIFWQFPVFEDIDFVTQTRD
jgi:hypothetical protein